MSWPACTCTSKCYIRVLDGRSPVSKIALRAQLNRPLPRGDDDARMFRQLCLMYDIQLQLPQPEHSVRCPWLMPALLRAPFVIVVTDAGLPSGSGILPIGSARLGLRITARHAQRLFNFGLRVVSFPSMDLEWVTCVLALWVLQQASYRGRIRVVCDT